MYIKQLEVDNFKSFANKVDIPLLQGFTTVSGPNGSGKSALIESILFALGLSTSRTLRSEKLFDFISNLTRRNEAIVKVTLTDGKDGDFSVTRKIKKSSQGYNSIYYLDDKLSSLTDIHLKLENYNITPNSYNIVMQGDVTSIAKATPFERRKVIDEIAGVADFNRRIEQANGELEVVRGRVERSTLILQGVEERIEQLKEEREVALKYQELKNKKTNLEGQISTVRFFDVKKNLELAHENIIDFTKKKSVKEKEAKDLEERYNIINEKFKEVSALVQEKGEAQLLETKKEAEEVKGLIERKNNAIDNADTQIHDKKRAIERFKNGIDEQGKAIDENKLLITTAEEEIKVIQNNKKLKQKELDKKLKDLTGLSQTAEQYINKRTDLINQKENLKNQEFELMQKKLPLEADLKQLNSDLEREQKNLEELIKFKEEFTEKKDSLELQINTLNDELESLKTLQQKTLQDIDKNKNEMSDLNYDIQATNRKIYETEADIKAAEKTNLGDAVDEIMNAHIKGVHAPLVKLGKVDPEYSKALGVAVGGRMSHIVVDDEHVASVAIEFLNSSNKGRATFIPLNKVVKAPTKLQLPKEKGVIDYAINLIDFDDEYLDTFYYAVGDTLIVEDQNTAKRLIRQYRMVTLNGELFEKSGAITGGSLKKNTLKFSQNSDEELDKYKKLLTDLQDKFLKADKKRLELDEKMNKIRDNYTDSKSALSGANVELNNLIGKFRTNGEQIQEKENFIKENKPLVSKISSKLDKLEEEHIELSGKLTDIQTKIDEIEGLMNDKDLKNLKEQTKDIENEIKKFDEAITASNNKITMANQKIEFQQSVINTNNDNIKDANDGISKLEQDKRTFTEEIKVQQEKLESLNEKIAEITEKLGELLKQKDEISASLVELGTNKNTTAAEIDKISEQIESFKVRRKELEPQLDEAKEVLVKAGIDISNLEPTDISVDEITAKIQRLEKKMEELGAVNMRALMDYDRVSAKQQEMKLQLETLSKEREQILEKMKGYEDLKKESFMKAFTNINENFKDVFHTLSDGEGKLVLECPDNPFEGGLTIEACPRDKKKQRLEGMSGGEQSLTALALVFAIQRYKPAPFYAFDEVDASLDGINVDKLAQMVKTQAKDAQFIVVSHKKTMVSSSDRTIGVTQREKGISMVTGKKWE